MGSLQLRQPARVLGQLGSLGEEEHVMLSLRMFVFLKSKYLLHHC